MEPIVIYLEDAKDEVKLTKKQFEKYIKDAYKQGYDNGYNAGKQYTPWWWNTQPYINTITTNNPPPLKINWDTGTTPNLTPQITCDAHNDL